MTKQEQVAAELEQAAVEVADFIEDCPDSTWHRVSQQDGRTVAALAYHCASGNDVALGWVCQMLAARPVYETPETHDAANDSEAERKSGVTKKDVSEALHRTTERTAHFLRSLTDEELERVAMLGVAGRQMSVGQFISNFSRHMRGHLDSMKEAAQA